MFILTGDLLVFRHVYAAGYFPVEASFVNESDNGADLFSILGHLGQLRSTKDNKLHFKLCYPGSYGVELNYPS